MRKVHVLFDEKCMDKNITYTRFPKTKKRRIVKKWNKKYFIEKIEPSKRLKLVGITMEDEFIGMCHPNLKPKLLEANAHFSNGEGDQLFIFEQE